MTSDADKKLRRKNRLYLICLLIFLAVIFGIGKLPVEKNKDSQTGHEMFYTNSSPSIPCGIYLKVPRLSLDRQDYVVYKPPAECVAIAMSKGWITNPDILFVKHIGGLDGDMYEVSRERGFYINHQYHGHISEEDALGQIIPHKEGTYIISGNKFLPVGDNPRSFDGRYTGPVPMENIQAKVIPFITEDILDIFW